ncbi:hypothetical protein [Pseudoalteromonas sp. S16_S37]|uniref:hypothetical protein n=1 Tax=Pseudoalteromonas sp. S16_S37 TaxID=2720228 RepID=UPI001680AF77|nr:hypothetical protein [Pseudoalteromonas sp. S16_S37]MBD1583580.1 hypothetical protein [Pseudoalteromonas sp. S16_S37]
MKKRILAAITITGLLSHCAIAGTNNAVSSVVISKYHSLQNALLTDANAVGISKERYAFAALKYERFMTKLATPAGYEDTDVPADILPFNQIPEVIEAKHQADEFSPEFQKRLTSAININDAKLASYLQLSVDELYPFIKEYAQSVIDGDVITKNKFNKDDASIMD